MRRLPLIALIATLSLAACATSTSQVSSGTETFSSGVGNAATAPLEDLNLRRQEIPEVLQQARANPYDRSFTRRCTTISTRVAALDDALGPDLDSPDAYADPALGDQAANAALDVVRDTATDFIPMRSWVRRLTGAERHSREVNAAIRAGLAQRSFLKGVGLQRRCAPPAAPAPLPAPTAG